MRLSTLFGQTLREAPSEAELISHKLLLRAGFIRQLGTGIFSLLPLARRSMTKIENIMRREINAIGGQEMTMPVVQPADLWKETGRWYQIGSEMGRLRDAGGRDMVLAMTHEEVVGDLVRGTIRSHRQLPALIYHIQTKWRDEPRARGGLIRVREFTMKDSYSLDADWEGLDRAYRAHYQAYFNIYHRCGLPTIAVRSDVGMMGGKMAHEFMYLTPIGEDTIVLCNHCGYTANRQVARFQKIVADIQEPRPVERVATPGTKTIAELAQYLDIPESATAKAVFLVATISGGEDPTDGPPDVTKADGAPDVTRADGAPDVTRADGAPDVTKFILALVRGDMEVNETKLGNAVKAKALRPALEEEIRAFGIAPGYGSPIGIRPGALVVVDDLIPQSCNLVAGANADGFHLLHTNCGRDYTADIVADIVSAQEGHACADCGAELRISRGVEVGNIFKLGTRYSDALGCTYLDRNGQRKPVIMGSYGIGSGRLLACIAEEHHDDMGLLWPITVSPFAVHMVVLKGGEETALTLYHDLTEAGIEVLLDDREELTAGVKFNDADLIGIPLRLTVGGRSLKAGGIELKHRGGTELTLVASTEVASRVQSEIITLDAAMGARAVSVPYKG